ncbi:uncharacterized protein LOC117889820 [Drosophila subobscura]|uniref:uncharacterized protein LOC117889820 n=1 Tax=Drosophila subobscura TaxID=7241 RepID=UPI00155A7D69|nr:uncharacterized protein LOC117889820 [Drosophila subobscura]
MSGAGKSCQRLYEQKASERTCPRDCFEPPDGPCLDYKLVLPSEDVVDPDVEVIQVSLKPDGPVRKEIDIRAECSKSCGRNSDEDKDKEEYCTLCATQERAIRPNLCSAECRPLQTILHLNEYTKRPLPKPSYKHSVMLDDNTVVGRCFPMLFRLRRIKNKCLSCGRDLLFRHPITASQNLLLLSNCCDVEVYPHKKVENMNNVPVGMITGPKRFTRRLLKDRSECRLFALPPPEPPTVTRLPTMASEAVPAKGKKEKGKKKGKK